jgi:hypothetical protein
VKPKTNATRSREEKLNGNTLGIINSLAAVLAATTVNSSSAKRKMIAKEFSRAYGILSGIWAEHYVRGADAEKKYLKKRSREIAEKTSEMVKGVPVCCVSRSRTCQMTQTLEECTACDPNATFACIRRPILPPEM